MSITFIMPPASRIIGERSLIGLVEVDHYYVDSGIQTTAGPIKKFCGETVLAQQNLSVDLVAKMSLDNMRLYRIEEQGKWLYYYGGDKVRVLESSTGILYGDY